MKRSWQIPRRTFLKGTGVSIGLPLLNAMIPVKARAASPQRMLFLWHPNGVPRGGPDTVLPQLDRVKDYMTVVRSMTHAYHDGPPGVNGANHCGFESMYTGVMTGHTPAGYARTIDQILAHEAPGLKGKMLDLAVIPELGPALKDSSQIMCNALSWRGPNDPVIPMSSPADFFKKIFQGVTPGAAADPAAEQIERLRLTEKRTVLAGVSQEVKSLKGKLGAEDRVKLDEYLTGVEGLDKQVTAILGKTQIIGSCKAPAAQAGNDYVAKLEALQSLVVKAFECDIARVISLMHAPAAAFGPSFGAKYVPGFTGSQGWHPASHDNDAMHTLVVQWHYKKVEEMMLQMKNGTENLLESTLVSWGTGISKGLSHAMGGIHNVLIGKGGGAFKTGQNIASNNAPLVNLWATVLDGFGLKGRSFGKGGTGIIPGILT